MTGKCIEPYVLFQYQNKHKVFSMSIKYISLFFLSVLFSSTSVLAEEQNQQLGFNVPKYRLNSIKEVLDTSIFSDDMPVTLTGHISHSLGGENYTFSDGTGSITIEIEHDKWFGVQVTPETKVIIQGEIDKEFNYTYIDVDYIRIAS